LFHLVTDGSYLFGIDDSNGRGPLEAAMAAEFSRRLKELVDGAMHDSREELRFALGMFADILLCPFDSNPQPVSSARRSASEVMEIVRAAAEVVNACHLLESRLFSAPAAYRIEDFEIPRPRSHDERSRHDELSRFLDQNIREAIGESPFVYVVWSSNPEHYLHVGKSLDGSGGARALELNVHGELFSALQQGSWMTLLTPRPANQAGAIDVEAAILWVLDSRRALPELCVKSEDVPGAPGAAYLAEIGCLLGELASKFQAPFQHLPRPSCR
jgi:hypothetical protein